MPEKKLFKLIYCKSKFWNSVSKRKCIRQNEFGFFILMSGLLSGHFSGKLKKYLVFPCTCTGVDLSGILWILFQITVVNLADENQELDMLILTSILKSKYQHLSMVFLFAV